MTTNRAFKPFVMAHGPEFAAMRRQALAEHCRIEPDEIADGITPAHHCVEIHEAAGDCVSWDAAGDTYLVLTDDEADKIAWANIRRDLWTFSPAFLSEFTGFPECVFSSLQLTLHDDCSPEIEDILCSRANWGGFCNAAVAADGRAHFLDTYDGEEAEIRAHGAPQGFLYVYRVD